MQRGKITRLTTEIPPHLPRTLADSLVPPLEHRALPAVINTLHRDYNILVLQPAARRERLDGAGDDPFGIPEARGQGPAVDEVELLVKDPGVLGVVNLKGAVGRDVLWLDRGEVCACYVGFGVAEG